MRAMIVWWDLSEAAETIETLRCYLRAESVDAFAGVQGLRFKMWISDQETQRWGAVLLFESYEAAEQPLPSRAAELIGYPPSQVDVFDVEATIEGRYAVAELGRHGRAFTEDRCTLDERSLDDG